MMLCFEGSVSYRVFILALSFLYGNVTVFTSCNQRG